MAMDIANYLNECAIDNAYPKDIGIKHYPKNFPSESERNVLIKSYLELYYEKLKHDKGDALETFEVWQKNFFPKFEQEVKQSCLLSSFNYAVWALVMLSDADITNNNVFHYKYAAMRVEMYKAHKQLFNL